jgi:hypothetical protein
VKKRYGAIGIVAGLLAGVGTAAALTANHPSIRAVSAAFDLKLSQPPSGVECNGPNGDLYQTFTGHWAGPQIDTSTESHPRSLTGTVLETSTTTVDLTTGHGVTSGTTELRDASKNIQYYGTFTMNVQLLPDGSSLVRGGVNVPFFYKGTLTGLQLIGNREQTVSPVSSGLEVKGTIGGAGPPEATGESDIPDLSAEFNGIHC